MTAAVVFSVVACSSDAETEAGVKMPAASKDLNGQSYQDVAGALEKAGFTNVETKALEDLIIGFLNGEDEVEEVAVEGDTQFSEDDRFPAGAEIVVSYHSFPEDQEEGDSSESAAPADGGDEIITIETNPELAALLTGSDSGDHIKAFSEKYRTQTIAFDGWVGNVAPEGNVEDYVNVLILAGDNGSGLGPAFQVTGDPNYAGSNIPSDIAPGMNVRITAMVGEYTSTQNLFHLVPTSIEYR